MASHLALNPPLLNPLPFCCLLGVVLLAAPLVFLTCLVEPFLDPPNGGLSSLRTFWPPSSCTVPSSKSTTSLPMSVLIRWWWWRRGQ